MQALQHIEVDRLYRGLRYIVRLRDRGFRCGYIQLPKVAGKVLRDNIDSSIEDYFSCHGGITFNRWIEKDDFLPPGWWIGFDCAHLHDGYDRDAVEKLIGSTWNLPLLGNTSAVTSEEVEKDCRSLIDQYFELIKQPGYHGTVSHRCSYPPAKHVRIVTQSVAWPA